MPNRRWLDILRDALAGCAGLALLQSLADFAELPMTGVPFVCSMILVIATPDSDAARPRNVVVGHLLAALSGCAAALLIVSSWWALPVAIGLAMFAMQATRTLHPPAGLTAAIATTQDVSWEFILSPVLTGALLLVFLCFFYFRSIGHRWPQSWF